ncbi:hypothetical protein STEG23_033182, partial [Scotinomys teguina]
FIYGFIHILFMDFYHVEHSYGRPKGLQSKALSLHPLDTQNEYSINMAERLDRISHETRDDLVFKEMKPPDLNFQILPDALVAL